MTDCEVSHRLRRRIADRGNDRALFSSQGCKFQETNLEVFNGDENHGKEEHPGGCSGIYTSPPCFDDYGDEEVSEEDYMWVTKALDGYGFQKAVASCYGVIMDSSVNALQQMPLSSCEEAFAQKSMVGVSIGFDGYHTNETMGFNGKSSNRGSLEITKISTDTSKAYLEDAVVGCSTKLSTILIFFPMESQTQSLVHRHESLVTPTYQEIENQINIPSFTNLILHGNSYFTTNAHDFKEEKKVELEGLFIDPKFSVSRPDVPFDPGGFGSTAKLEDEFF
ncbi:hypothetical protein E3N88_30733 [Mikania micrantha]|uniref:Uncharacterized protein n=1 Tax=Mikania micrantha TaxID=192012 RepID=A0A5N6MNF0_9ASTR|nr:hypothetical protein E3N88_30733 [Mikania micrantha]